MPLDPARRSRYAWEPGMAQGPDGAIWAIGNHCALVDQHGICEVDPATPGFEPDYTPLWRSTDGGRTYAWVADPLRALKSSAHAPDMSDALAQDHPGGYDTDVAVAPVARAGRPALVYAVSAWEAGTTLAVSADNGRTWTVYLLTGIPIQDRPWLAASGPCDLFMQYHPLTGAYDVASVARVDRYDGCALADQAALGHTQAHATSSTLVEPAVEEVTRTNSVMGKLAAGGGRTYLAYVACDTALADLNCDAPGNQQSIHVAISSNAARSFTDVPLPGDPGRGPLNDGTWPVALAADATGRVAVVRTDTHHVTLWTSPDFGRTWRRRATPVDAPLGWGRATVPTVALGGSRLAVAWYDSAPAPAGAPQRWQLAVARSADDGGSLPVSVLPTVLATTAHDELLASLLYDDNAALLTPRGDLALAYTESCADHPPTDAACPGPAGAQQGTMDVVRSALVADPPSSGQASPPGSRQRTARRHRARAHRPGRRRRAGHRR